MITMVDSMQSEMVWSSLATVRAVAAELRPVSGKTTSCGGTGLLGATRSGLG